MGLGLGYIGLLLRQGDIKFTMDGKTSSFENGMGHVRGDAESIIGEEPQGISSNGTSTSACPEDIGHARADAESIIEEEPQGSSSHTSSANDSERDMGRNGASAESMMGEVPHGPLNSTSSFGCYNNSQQDIQEHCGNQDAAIYNEHDRNRNTGTANEQEIHIAAALDRAIANINFPQHEMGHGGEAYPPPAEEPRNELAVVEEYEEHREEFAVVEEDEEHQEQFAVEDQTANANNIHLNPFHNEVEPEFISFFGSADDFEGDIIFSV